MKARADTSRARLAGVGLVLALLAACGDDGSVTTPTPTPPTPAPPTPPPATLVLSGERALPAPRPGNGRTVSWDFTIAESGTVDVTISYLHDDSKILAWVTDRQCTRWQFERDECDYLTKSLDGPRPRGLTASGVEAGTYSLFVANDGPHDEEIGCEVFLTAGASASGR
jgi:hypothetical protein